MNSIRLKLMLWLLLPLCAIAAIVSLETFYSSRKISNDLSDRTLLAASLTILENVISSNGSLLADATLDTLTENLGDRFFYHVRGPGGAFVTGYSGYPRPPVETNLKIGEPHFYDGVHLGEPVRVALLQRDLTGREFNGLTTITTWQRTTQRSTLTLRLFAQSLFRLVLLVLAAGAIVWFAIRMGLRPLIQLQSAIDRRTPHDLTPIKRAMPRELAGITKSMNDLFARVARSKSNRERFIGDAAHQLRNPVAAIKVQAQAALESQKKSDMQSGLQQIIDVSNSSNDMINQMLAGASAHAMDRSQDKTFDFSAMLQRILALAAPSAFAKNQEISLEGAEKPIHFNGNETLLQEAVGNLINNAIRYNQEDTLIEVQLSQSKTGVTVAVEDRGRSFSSEEFLQLTQPFTTGNTGASGSGLGLSIAKDIAKSHGGHLTIEKRNEGKAICIVLPSGQQA